MASKVMVGDSICHSFHKTSGSPVQVLMLNDNKDWPATQELLFENAKLLLSEKDCRNDPACYVLKAVDIIADEILGVAVWFIHSSPPEAQSPRARPTKQPHVCKSILLSHILIHF